MQIKEKLFEYYLFSLSNFIAAFGGGMILGKGVNVIDIPLLQGGSVLAFFIGTVLGLFFLQLIPNKLSINISKYLSIAGGFSSLILFGIFKNNAFQEKISGDIAVIFFFLLSMRFGFWFYSRVSRASLAAGQKQQIAWVELGYYSGMILGLIIWKLSGFNITLISALFMDALLQFAAGFLDLYANKKIKDYYPIEVKNFLNNNMPYNPKIFNWKLPCVVILITISTQAIIFSLTHYVSSSLGTYILATFYFGAAISSFICKKFNVFLEKNSIIFTIKNKRSIKIDFLSIGFLVTIFITIAIFDVNFWLLKNSGEITLLFSIFCSAFLYEILALAILDKIGLEDRFSNQKRRIVRTYAFMGISAALSLWIIGLTHSSLFGLLIILGICTFFSIGIMRTKSHVTSISNY